MVVFFPLCSLGWSLGRLKEYIEQNNVIAAKGEFFLHMQHLLLLIIAIIFFFGHMFIRQLKFNHFTITVVELFELIMVVRR